MAAEVQAIVNRVTMGLAKWSVQVSIPYLRAYNAAYKSYDATLKAQADADKATAELFVAAASIVTGSLLMATVAQTSFRVIAGDAALNFVCDRNLVRTFNAMAVAADNKAFMFALGKTLDQIKDSVGKAIKDDVTKLFQAGDDIRSSDPLDKVLEFESLFKKHYIATVSAAERIAADRQMAESKKALAFAALNAAPICTPPASTIDSNNLAKKIELCFYLKTILDSDELVDWGPYYPGMTDRRPTGSHPIPQLPSAPDYPRPPVPTTGAGQTIGYTRPGPTVRDRIDALSKDIFKEPFYAGENWLSHKLSGVADNADGRQKAGELLKAERRIDDLALAVRPTAILELKS